MISREDALDLLEQEGTPQIVIAHCKAVARKALELADRLGQGDRDLIEIGSLLHDIGRSKTHGLGHAVAGSRIIRDRGLPEELALIVERHIGGGIPRDEAAKHGLPERDYIPETIEEKIVCYADKLVSDDREVSYADIKAKYSERFGQDSVPLKMLEELHTEMTLLLKDQN